MHDAGQSAAAAPGSGDGRGWEGRQDELAERLQALLADAEVVPELGPSRAHAAFWLVWGRSGRMRRARWEQLRRVLSRLDLYAEHGRGRRGAGLEVLIGQLLAHRQALDEPWLFGATDPPPAPASLAFYLPELERRSRDWRRRGDADRRQTSAEWRARRGVQYERQAKELRKR